MNVPKEDVQPLITILEDKRTDAYDVSRRQAVELVLTLSQLKRQLESLFKDASKVKRNAHKVEARQKIFDNSVSYRVNPLSGTLAQRDNAEDVLTGKAGAPTIVLDAIEKFKGRHRLIFSSP